MIEFRWKVTKLPGEEYNAFVKNPVDKIANTMKQPVLQTRKGELGSFMNEYDELCGGAVWSEWEDVPTEYVEE